MRLLYRKVKRLLWERWLEFLEGGIEKSFFRVFGNYRIHEKSLEKIRIFRKRREFLEFSSKEIIVSMFGRCLKFLGVGEEKI